MNQLQRGHGSYQDRINSTGSPSPGRRETIDRARACHRCGAGRPTGPCCRRHQGIAMIGAGWADRLTRPCSNGIASAATAAVAVVAVVDEGVCGSSMERVVLTQMMLMLRRSRRAAASIEPPPPVAAGPADRGAAAPYEARRLPACVLCFRSGWSFINWIDGVDRMQPTRRVVGGSNRIEFQRCPATSSRI